MNGIAELYRLRLAETIAAGDTTPMMVFPIGEWHSARYPDLPLTEDLADELIANFEAGVLGTEPVVDSSGKHDTAAPAAGWVKRVYLASYEEGTVTGLALWADVQWTGLGATLLSDDQYKYGSVEIGPVTTNAAGDEIDNVLRSLTLTNTPVLRIMPGVKNAAEKQRVTVTLSLSEVTLAAAPVDPVQSILDDMDALAAKADASMKGKKGMPDMRAMMRQARAKVSAHSLSEDPDGNPVVPDPASSDGSSQPAKAAEGQPVTLDEGDPVPKGSDPMNPKFIKALKLSEDATDEAVEAAVVQLAEDRDAEKTRADTAELKLAEVAKAKRAGEVEVELAEITKVGNLTPGEKPEFVTLAEEKPDVYAARVAERKALPEFTKIKLGEVGDGTEGDEVGETDPSVELTQLAEKRAAKDGIDEAAAMTLVLAENPNNIKERYVEFTTSGSRK